MAEFLEFQAGDRRARPRKPQLARLLDAPRDARRRCRRIASQFTGQGTGSAKRKAGDAGGHASRAPRDEASGEPGEEVERPGSDGVSVFESEGLGGSFQSAIAMCVLSSKS